MSFGTNWPLPLVHVSVPQKVVPKQNNGKEWMLRKICAYVFACDVFCAVHFGVLLILWTFHLFAFGLAALYWRHPRAQRRSPNWDRGTDNL